MQRSVLLNGLFLAEGAIMFALDIALAAALGLSAQSDILYAAWSLPVTIGRGMFQSLTNSFMGVFAKADDQTTAYNQAITVIGIVAFAAGALLSLSARWWYPLSVPGATAETKLAGQPLAAILAWLIFLLALAETLRAIYYRSGRLVVPTAGRIIGTAVTIVVTLLAGARQDLWLVAWGLMGGAAVETLVGFVGLAWLPGFRLRPNWPERVVLSNMARSVGMPLTGQGVRVLSSIAERALASLLGPGVLTAVTFAARLIAIVERFVFRGFQLATIQNYTAGIKQNYNARLRIVALLALPMSVGLALLAPQLVNAVFARGRFSADDAITVAQVLQTYAPSIIGLALISIPLGLAFARNLPRVVMFFYAFNALALIASEYLLLRLGVGLRSFGIANSIAAFLGLLWLSRTVARNDKLWTRADSAQLVVIAAVAAAGTFAVRSLAVRLPAGNLVTWITLLAGGAACAVSAVVAAWLLRMEEIDQIGRLLRRPSPPNQPS